MPSPQFMPGPWPAEYLLVQTLRDLGFREQTIHGMAYRQKFAIVRDHTAREAKTKLEPVQLALFTKEV